MIFGRYADGTASSGGRPQCTMTTKTVCMAGDDASCVKVDPHNQSSGFQILQPNLLACGAEMLPSACEHAECLAA